MEDDEPGLPGNGCQETNEGDQTDCQQASRLQGDEQSLACFLLPYQQHTGQQEEPKGEMPDPHGRLIDLLHVLHVFELACVVQRLISQPLIGQCVDRLILTDVAEICAGKLQALRQLEAERIHREAGLAVLKGQVFIRNQQPDRSEQQQNRQQQHDEDLEKSGRRRIHMLECNVPLRW
jgi:hypothetical protein